VVYATNVAEFNNVSEVKLSTNLTSQAYSNNSKSGVICQTAPTAYVGSVNQYEPNNVVWVGVGVPSNISRIDLSVLDQNNDPLPLDDDFSCSIIIQY
jgi:hypothetical protein